MKQTASQTMKTNVLYMYILTYSQMICFEMVEVQWINLIKSMLYGKKTDRTKICITLCSCKLVNVFIS